MNGIKHKTGATGTARHVDGDGNEVGLILQGVVQAEADEIGTLFSAMKTAEPAPGVGKMIRPLMATMLMNPGSGLAFYSGTIYLSCDPPNDSMGISCDALDSQSDPQVPFVSRDFSDKNADKRATVASVENKPLMFWTDHDLGDPSGGEMIDGWIRVTYYYSIEDVA